MSEFKYECSECGASECVVDMGCRLAPHLCLVDHNRTSVWSKVEVEGTAEPELPEFDDPCPDCGLDRTTCGHGWTKIPTEQPDFPCCECESFLKEACLGTGCDDCDCACDSCIHRAACDAKPCPRFKRKAAKEATATQIVAMIEERLTCDGLTYWNGTSEQNEFVVMAQRDGLDVAIREIELLAQPPDEVPETTPSHPCCAECAPELRAGCDARACPGTEVPDEHAEATARETDGVPVTLWQRCDDLARTLFDGCQSHAIIRVRLVEILKAAGVQIHD